MLLSDRFMLSGTVVGRRGTLGVSVDPTGDFVSKDPTTGVISAVTLVEVVTENELDIA